MGASLSTGNARNKRKSQDAMNVDNEWNGWCNPPGYHYYDSYPVGPEPEQEYYATPRHAFEEPRTIFPPAINRYSVNMEDGSGRSISDVSMYDDTDTAPTPRATTPEPSTPKATKSPLTAVNERPSKKVTIVEEQDEEDEDEREEGEENEEGDDEEQVETPKKSSKRVQLDKKASSSKGAEKDNAPIPSPMEEDPPTPKARSPALPAREPTMSPQKKSSIVPSRSQSQRRSETPTLKSRASSNDSSPPRTPKLTLRTDFQRSPLVAPSQALSINFTDKGITNSPEELHFESAISKLKGLDLMDVVAPSAAVVETPARTASTFEHELREAQEVEAARMRVHDLPTLLPAAMITEKKVSHRPKSRRGSVNSDATIACSPRRAAIIAGKRNSSKTSLPTVDQIHEIVSTAALRAQIDALPLENQDDNRQASNWPDDQIPSRLILPDRSTLTSLAFRIPYVSR
ncbi:hypothetical protein FRB91_002677 [Serendipita sp. 411]|nr:hypothetical protein FRB91_002677 [Serendipita sp. 411]